MKITTILVLVILLGFTACKEEKKESGKTTGETLISEIVKDLNQKKSIHFSAVQKYWYEGEKDTTITPYEVWAVRGPKNALKNAYVWVDNNYSPYHLIYENGESYLSIPRRKISIFYSDFDEELISPADWIDFFLEPASLTGFIRNNGNNAEFSNVTFKGVAADKIVINVPEDKKGESYTYTYILSKEDHSPLWSQMIKRSKDQVYTDEIAFTDITYDQVDLKSLKKKQAQILKDNPVEEQDSDEMSRLGKMIHIGEKAPLFEGKYYGSDKIFRLKDHIGKSVIIIDFWYTHCPPCVKAMPELSKLNAEYKDQGLKVFGLNSVDNRPVSLDNLDRFLNNRELSYDVIMTYPDVDRRYKIVGYPAMYLVDKKGNISYVELGYDEEKFAKFKQNVVKLLKE